MLGRAFRAAPISCAAVLAAVFATGARAQQPQTVFHAGTDLVEVDAVVHDRAGRFVPDLSAADFEVLEDGQPRQVDLLTVVGGIARSGATAPAPPGPSNAAGSPLTEVRDRVFIAVFDDEHLSPGGFKRVQAAARSLFEKAFHAGDIGGVVIRGEMANRRLTSDRSELLKDVADARPSSGAGSRLSDQRAWPRMSEAEAVRIRVDNDAAALEAVYQRACADEPDECKGRIDVRAIIVNKATQVSVLARTDSENTIKSLSGLFNALQRFAGPKIVLLLTEGFVAEESWPLVEQSIARAARADARLYVLDARAMDRAGLGDRLTGPDPGNDQAYAALIAQMDVNGDAMNSLAVDTGGFVVRNTNRFDAAVARIADEASTYYVLGFRPATIDGRFHKLVVRVKRPGLTVRARRGYIATAHAVPTLEALATPIGPATVPGSMPVESAPPAVTGSSSAAPSSAAAAISARGTTAGTVARLRPDAVQHAATLAANAPRDDDAAKGWDAYQRGDLESARASLASAASTAGARPWVSYALGQAQYGLRAYRDAAASWERVRSAAPEFEPVYFDLVDAYLQLKDYDRATSLMRDAAKRWPVDADVYEALGVVEVKRGSLDDAVKSFEAAIAKAPADSVGYFNLANALELRYRHSRRWVAVAHRWYENEHDRDGAIENYNRCLKIGGPLDDAARAGLKRLDWTAK